MTTSCVLVIMDIIEFLFTDSSRLLGEIGTLSIDICLIFLNWMWLGVWITTKDIDVWGCTIMFIFPVGFLHIGAKNNWRVLWMGLTVERNRILLSRKGIWEISIQNVYRYCPRTPYTT